MRKLASSSKYIYVEMGVREFEELTGILPSNIKDGETISLNGIIRKLRILDDNKRLVKLKKDLEEVASSIAALEV